MNNTPKVVITRTLDASHSKKATVANGDLVESVTALKQQPVGDLIAYGGGKLVAGLIEHELIDELHLFVSTTAIGSGMPVFGTPEKYKAFTPVHTTPFESGMFAIHLESRRS